MKPSASSDDPADELASASPEGTPGGGGRWAGEEGWRRAEDWLVERLASLGWWEAAVWAAGHERTRPRLTAMALQTYTTQAAGEAKQDELQAAVERLATRARGSLWSDPALGPPAGVDPDSVAEVEEAAVGVVSDALTAVFLSDELTRGVLPRRRHEQLLEAVVRAGLPEFGSNTDGSDIDGSNIDGSDIDGGTG